MAHIPKPHDEAAFPRDQIDTPYGEVLMPTQWGLTKREYAAIQIAAGLCANGIPGSQHTSPNVASEAVAVVDELFKRLGLGESDVPA